MNTTATRCSLFDWFRNLIGDDPHPAYSRLDRLGGLR